MNWLTAFLASSVGRKYVMGLTGLFLCLFLIVHLGGNLLLYVGADVYNKYAQELHANPALLISVEVILYAAFVIHIYLALTLTGSNRTARHRRYEAKETKIEGRTINVFGCTPDNTMFLTGFVGLLFLIVHVSDFKLGLGFSEAVDAQTPYVKAQIIVADVTRGVIYIIGSVVLGVHVGHGLQSAFQSLGLEHPKYTPTIRCFSWLFGVLVAVGFSSFPFVAWLKNWGAAGAGL